MKQIDIHVTKIFVYDEVAEATSYAGAKDEADSTAYQRIFTTDEDRHLLERFWTEASALITASCREFIYSVSDNSQPHGVDILRDFHLSLRLPERFDERLVEALNSDAKSFFIAYIVAAWYRFANKKDAQLFLSDADSSLLALKQKLYHRTPPQRR